MSNTQVAIDAINQLYKHDEVIAELEQQIADLQAKRKPLSDDQIIEIGKQARAVEGNNILPVLFARAIEAAHGIKHDD